MVECAYVSSKVTEAPYFSTPLQLGVCVVCTHHFHAVNDPCLCPQPKGIKENLGLGKLSDFEQERMLEVREQQKTVDRFTICVYPQVIPELQKNIQKGVDFVRSQS